MDIKELDKKQLILLTLLITFVVSIATGIVTVSLMNQMPKNVPQTINNVIQRTIEKVTTVQVPTAPETNSTATDTTTNSKPDTSLLLGSNEVLVPIYLNNKTVSPSVSPDTATSTVDNTNIKTEVPSPIGQGVIISEVGLILVDSNLINDSDSYKVVLNKTDFNASILKRFSNGFTVLKISPIIDTTTVNTDTSTKTQ